MAPQRVKGGDFVVVHVVYDDALDPRADHVDVADDEEGGGAHRIPCPRELVRHDDLKGHQSEDDGGAGCQARLDRVRAQHEGEEVEAVEQDDGDDDVLLIVLRVPLERQPDGGKVFVGVLADELEELGYRHVQEAHPLNERLHRDLVRPELWHPALIQPQLVLVAGGVRDHRDLLLDRPPRDLLVPPLKELVPLLRGEVVPPHRVDPVGHGQPGLLVRLREHQVDVQRLDVMRVLPERQRDVEGSLDPLRYVRKRRRHPLLHGLNRDPLQQEARACCRQHLYVNGVWEDDGLVGDVANGRPQHVAALVGGDAVCLGGTVGVGWACLKVARDGAARNLAFFKLCLGAYRDVLCPVIMPHEQQLKDGSERVRVLVELEHGLDEWREVQGRPLPPPRQVKYGAWVHRGGEVKVGGLPRSLDQVDQSWDLGEGDAEVVEEKAGFVLCPIHQRLAVHPCKGGGIVPVPRQPRRRLRLTEIMDWRAHRVPLLVREGRKRCSSLPPCRFSVRGVQHPRGGCERRHPLRRK
mmetsp:Transcript_13748/g.31834  ORF Transcript_13748/g.31834 Transcript_13748/m.31834 type:complete len:523 (-) Transcript_13748:88-1656(-)